MSKVKFDFLNWRPDQEDYRNAGLIEADNILHSEEGYLSYREQTNFVTNTVIGTCASLVIKSVGTGVQKVVAYLNNPTVAGAGYTIDMNIGLLSALLDNVSNYTTITSGTILSAITNNSIVAFDVCELGGTIFMSAQAELPTITVLNASGAPVVTLNATGYATI